MKNEYILRWLGSFGKDWVGLVSIDVEELRWMTWNDDYIESSNTDDGRKYRLTNKAIQKLSETTN